ncbi:hypothetical protein V8C35DRAFT_208217 [Trichoderma chlorosporum]
MRQTRPQHSNSTAGHSLVGISGCACWQLPAALARGGVEALQLELSHLQRTSYLGTQQGPQCPLALDIGHPCLSPSPVPECHAMPLMRDVQYCKHIRRGDWTTACVVPALKRPSMLYISWWGSVVSVGQQVALYLCTCVPVYLPSVLRYHISKFHHASLALLLQTVIIVSRPSLSQSAVDQNPQAKLLRPSYGSLPIKGKRSLVWRPPATHHHATAPTLIPANPLCSQPVARSVLLRIRTKARLNWTVRQ